MPYKNREIQREFQREWSKQKKEKLVLADPRKALEFKFKRCVTWDQLQDNAARYKSIQDFNECTRIARTLFNNRKIDRFKIAELAIQACVIKLGGDNRSQESIDNVNKLTVTAFAEEIGMHYKTLDHWIRVRKLVDLLPKETPLDLSTMNIVYRQYEMHELENPAFLLESYIKFFNNEDNIKDFTYSEKSLRNFIFMMNRRGIQRWTDEQVTEIDTLVHSIVSQWDHVKKEKTNE